jgi:hypothetical protein
MSDPSGSSMSLAAVLVLAVVSLLLLGGWLMVVFRADRPPARKTTRPGGQVDGHDAEPRPGLRAQAVPADRGAEETA